MMRDPIFNLSHANNYDPLPLKKNHNPAGYSTEIKY